MKFVFTPRIEKKLKDQHSVSVEEVEQCFWNRIGDLLEEHRDGHKTDPPSLWFISETDRRRKLKVIFVQEGNKVFIKSAYEPSKETLFIYKKLVKKN